MIKWTQFYGDKGELMPKKRENSLEGVERIWKEKDMDNKKAHCAKGQVERSCGVFS